MASIGLAIARGNEIYDTEVQRREELDRFLAGRALYDTQLRNEEINSAIALEETQRYQASYEKASPYFEGIRSGDTDSFISMSNELGLGFEYNSETGDYYKNGKLVGKMSSSDMQNVLYNSVIRPMESAASASATASAETQAMNQHMMDMAKLEYQRDTALGTARIRAASSGSGNSSGKSWIETPEEYDAERARLTNEVIPMLYGDKARVNEDTGEWEFQTDGDNWGGLSPIEQGYVDMTIEQLMFSGNQSGYYAGDPVNSTTLMNNYARKNAQTFYQGQLPVLSPQENFRISRSGGAEVLVAPQGVQNIPTGNTGVGIAGIAANTPASEAGGYNPLGQYTGKSIMWTPSSTHPFVQGRGTSDIPKGN